MDTKKCYYLFSKENVCGGYSLEAALSNVNDSFTASSPNIDIDICLRTYSLLRATAV